MTRDGISSVNALLPACVTPPRLFPQQKTLYTQNAPFHVVITSYQLVVQDVKYFQRVKWQYMVLDEAQALKSSTRYIHNAAIV